MVEEFRSEIRSVNSVETNWAPIAPEESIRTPGKSVLVFF